RVGLDIDLLLEQVCVYHAHEFMCIAGVAVPTSKFAAAIGVDRVRERHARAGAFVENAAALQFVIRHLRLRFRAGAARRQPRNTDEGFRGGKQHLFMFAFYSPRVKPAKPPSEYTGEAGAVASRCHEEVSPAVARGGGIGLL